MSVEPDVGSAYTHYYTHGNEHQNATQGDDTAQREWFWMALHWLSGKVIAASTQCFSAIRQERLHRLQFYLNAARPGRLLEVGCGDGRNLAALRSLGWQVEGPEVDIEAAEQARRMRGLVVHEGRLDDLRLNAGSYDAILMSHVTEHVKNPLQLLIDCHELLREGGSLVMITPNVESFGHREFGKSWRGLEPPGHLYLFSLEILARITQRSGFTDIEAWTSPEISEFVALESLRTKTNQLERFGPASSWKVSPLARGFELAMNLAWVKDRSFGEECVVRARRSSIT